MVTSNYPRWESDTTTPFILHLAQDLTELGWHIDVLAPHAPGAARAEKLGGVPVRRFRYLWPVGSQTVCYQGGALINLRKNKSNYVKLPALVFFECLSVIWSLMWGRYDLVHTHWILPQGFTGVVAARLCAIRHITSIHGSDMFSLNGTLLKIFKRFALAQADAVTANSSVTERAALDLGASMKSLTVIPVGVSTQSGSAELAAKIRAEHAPDANPLLVFIGRVVEEKGLDELMRAIKLLQEGLPNVVLLVLGEGQERDHFESLSQQLGVSKHVKFAGWVDSAHLPHYLAAADIFVGPSRFEAQGLTFVEAMIAKVPVVATRAGGIVDAVKHEETGLLVDINAPEQIRDAVLRYMNDPDLVNSVTAAGYELASNRFSRQASAASFERLYFDVIERK